MQTERRMNETGYISRKCSLAVGKKLHYYHLLLCFGLYML